MVTGLRCGNKINKTWKNKEIKFDFYDIKSDIIAVLNVLQFPVSKLKLYNEAPNYFHPGRSAVLKLGKTIISIFGQINPLSLDQKDNKIEFYAFELYLDNLPIPKKKTMSKPLLKLNQLQPLYRDFSFIVDKDLDAQRLINEIKLVDQNQIKKIFVFDIFKGNNIPDDKKSISLSVEIQPINKSLTDNDLESISYKIINIVSQNLGAEIRVQ